MCLKRTIDDSGDVPAWWFSGRIPPNNLIPVNWRLVKQFFESDATDQRHAISCPHHALIFCCCHVAFCQAYLMITRITSHPSHQESSDTWADEV